MLNLKLIYFLAIIWLLADFSHFSSVCIVSASFSFHIQETFYFWQRKSSTSTKNYVLSVFDTNNATKVLEIPTQEANYPGLTSATTLSGVIINAIPANACELVIPTNVIKIDNYEEIDLILLANKLDCPFETKLNIAKVNGFHALLIYNYESNSTEIVWENFTSNLNNGSNKNTIAVLEPSISENQSTVNSVIPSYFLGEFNGNLLREHYTYKDRYFVRIEIQAAPFYQEVILYLAWIGLLVIILISCYHFFRPCFVFMVHPCCIKIYRRNKQAYLVKALTSIPIIEWKAQTPPGPVAAGEIPIPVASTGITKPIQERFENCVICLEDYADGEHLRVLYCGHGFHQTCIDKWLTNRQQCPICKSKLHKSTPNTLVIKCCYICCCVECETDSDLDLSDNENTHIEHGFDPAFNMIHSPNSDSAVNDTLEVS